MNARQSKVPVIKWAGVNIRCIRDDFFQVDVQDGLKPDGTPRRIREGFKTLPEAKVRCDQLNKQRQNAGTEAWSISTAERIDAVEAMKLLKDTGKTLSYVASWYLERNPTNGGEALATTCARYVAQMEQDGLRPISIKEKRLRFAKFVTYFGADRVTVSLSTAEAVEFCTKNGYTGTTKNNYLRAFKNLLNYYAGTKKVPHRKATAAVTFTADQVESIMRAAESHCAESLPAWAVLFFCGLRPAEVDRLTWKHIDLAAASIRITPDISKIQNVRHVDIPANAMQWLVAASNKTGLVSGGENVFRRFRRVILEKTGIEKWPVDVTRHTFATMHYTLHQSADKTLFQLGHTGGSQMFLRHYKGICTPADAARYFEIKPAGDAKLLKFA